ncbi:uncharacterized protein [Spinacia oleracea]|uniref:Uncharacterized protein LOC110786063 n=1 Tax=Spinacia oleracea TaxID=3562 RepID=A0A9R0II84_SPIOL|nr:uncharacterized protein LOC110786063 [Spinacia oleracea]XP_021849483.1 uncharacterized protein LOC110789141 [Spinacia oleracea]XP_021859605.1 uncharacterized protein LOC110798728 [Spinacia oleracea]XP_056690805.1 uncharacterized protein LOC130466105 [Spinacia oleracea]
MAPWNEVKCGCGFPVAKRTAWTHENPGRKFIACKFYNPETGQRGCNKFDWLDEDIVEWQRDVTNVLVAEKHRLSTDLAILRNRFACIEQEKIRLVEEVDRLKKNKGMMMGVLGSKKAGLGQNQLMGMICVCAIVSVLFSFTVIKVLG